MERTLSSLFEEALLDENASAPSVKGRTCRMRYGTMIVRDDQTMHIRIFRTCGGDDYVEYTQFNCNVLLQKGWLVGSTTIALQSYKSKIDVANETLAIERKKGIKGKRKSEYLVSEIADLEAHYKKLLLRLQSL